MSKTLSEQLRDAIVHCGTTRYALAQQLDISESALSRFVSGERGLTLDVIDKLADVLGLQIISTVQRTRRPAARGRKPKGQPMTATATRMDWKSLSQFLASDAYEHHFESRRGLWFVEHADAICLYDNNPFGDFEAGKGSAKRDRIISAVRSYLKKNGHKELASATYPPDGESAGYTLALLVAGKEADMGPIQDAWLNAVRSEL